MQGLELPGTVFIDEEHCCKMIQAELLISISLSVEKARRAGEETRSTKVCVSRGRGFCCGPGFVWFERRALFVHRTFSLILSGGERDA